MCTLFILGFSLPINTLSNVVTVSLQVEGSVRVKSIIGFGLVVGPILCVSSVRVT